MPRNILNLTTTDARNYYRELVHNYWFKPDPIFSYRNAETVRANTLLTFGVEVEVSLKPNEFDECVRSSCAKAITDLEPTRIYLKRDSSVNYGFEIVSHPASLASHMYDAHWSGVLSKCQKHGLHSHDAKNWGNGQSCGLHVHVGRAQFGHTEEERDAVVRKVKILVYKHWDEMAIFSRRTQRQLNMWAKRELSVDLIDSLMSAPNPETRATSYIGVSNDHDDRYVAVNCEHSATIEFRLFNGTLKRDTFMATLQLCNAICKYAMTHTFEECVNSEFKAVALYERYNELDTYLLARGLILESDIPARAQNTQRNCSHHGRDGLEG